MGWADWWGSEMAVDVSIGSIEAKVSAADPELLRDPVFLARLVAMVKEELAREALEEGRRAADRRPGQGGGGR